MTVIRCTCGSWISAQRMAKGETLCSLCAAEQKYWSAEQQAVMGRESERNRKAAAFDRLTAWLDTFDKTERLMVPIREVRDVLGVGNPVEAKR